MFAHRALESNGKRAAFNRFAQFSCCELFYCPVLFGGFGEDRLGLFISHTSAGNRGGLRVL